MIPLFGSNLWENWHNSQHFFLKQYFFSLYCLLVSSSVLLIVATLKNKFTYYTDSNIMLLLVTLNILNKDALKIIIKGIGLRGRLPETEF